MKEKKLKPASEEFWDCIITAGSIVIDCEFCGKTHFVTDPGLYDDEQELKELWKNEEKNPEKYKSYPDYDSISWGYLDGKQAVYMCECNKVRVYEDFFWSHRAIILNYFRKRIEENLEEAQKDMKLLDSTGYKKLKKFLEI